MSAFSCTFADGPAKGVTLRLARGVWLLRVVQNAAGEWDALDQLDDTPEPDERVYVYTFNPGTISHAFVDYHTINGGRRGERVTLAEYVYRAEQPPDDVVRDNRRWRKWCFAQQEAKGVQEVRDGNG